MQELLMACGQIAMVTMVISFLIGSFFTLIVLLMTDMLRLRKSGGGANKGNGDGA